MSRPVQPPYRVVYSGVCREEMRQLLMRARAKGRLDEVVRALQDVETRLAWVPLEFGEPLRDLVQLGIVVHTGALSPLVVEYGVDEARRIVYVSMPFRLLPNSGL